MNLIEFLNHQDSILSFGLELTSHLLPTKLSQ